MNRVLPEYKRLLKNFQFCSRSRKTIPPKAGLTTEILLVFRGLKFESDERDWAKGDVFKGLIKTKER
jgi:hypothetical protein